MTAWATAGTLGSFFPTRSIRASREPEEPKTREGNANDARRVRMMVLRILKRVVLRDAQSGKRAGRRGRASSEVALEAMERRR